MSFTAKELLEKLSIPQKVMVPKPKIHQSLSQLCFRDGYVMAFDGSVGVRVSLPKKFQSTSKLRSVSGKSLSQFLESLGDQPVSFSNKKEMIQVKSKNKEGTWIELATADPEEFLFQGEEPKTTVSVPAYVFEHLNDLSVSVSRAPKSVYEIGVGFHFSEDQVTAISNNDLCVGVVGLEKELPEALHGKMIPFRFFELIIEVLENSSEETVQMYCNDTSCYVEVGDYLFTCVLPDLQEMEEGEVVGELIGLVEDSVNGLDKTVELPDEFKNAVNRLKIVNSSLSMSSQWTFDKGSIGLEAYGDLSRVHDEVNVEELDIQKTLEVPAVMVSKLLPMVNVMGLTENALVLSWEPKSEGDRTFLVSVVPVEGDDE